MKAGKIIIAMLLLTIIVAVGLFLFVNHAAGSGCTQDTKYGHFEYIRTRIITTHPIWHDYWGDDIEIEISASGVVTYYYINVERVWVADYPMMDGVE